MTGEGFFAYNSQLVSFVSTLNPLYNAEYTPEDAFTLYHLIQEDTLPKKDYGGPALPALGHALAGAVASALSKSLVYPIDVIVTRLQVQKGLKGDKEAEHAASDADAEYKDPIDAARKIYKNEGGLGAFYTGLSSDVVKGLADSFLFFLAYTAAREQMLKRQGGKQLPVLKELSVGILAGAFSKAITMPISNIVTRQQTAALVAARDPTSSTSPGESDKLSVRDIALQIRSEKGIQGFWAGYSAQLILTLNPAITFAVDNLLRNVTPKKYRENPSFIQTFLVAALSKVIATSITYPVTLAKSRAQASQGSPSNSEYEEVDPSDHKIDPTATATQRRVKQTIRQATKLLEGQAALLYSLRRIYRQEGARGLYSGLDGEVVKGFLQHGLTMVVKENVHGGVIQLYYILLKLTKRWPEEFNDAAKKAEQVAASAAQEAKNLGKKVVG
ncbi:hypothetical protein PRZ48_005765 [Zasmidium cellare]|uniref:Mitochondrial carrier n=1 Tax=Zasmidium cellare TaxID=395010 RepID=A0ABR0ELF9_ZASCE|nr:hypothetical protein PRZ48_005765 [Zasmidium cellare]